MGESVLVSTLDKSVNIRVKTGFETRSTFCKKNVFNENSSAESKWFKSLKLANKRHVFKGTREYETLYLVAPCGMVLRWHLYSTPLSLQFTVHRVSYQSYAQSLTQLGPGRSRFDIRHYQEFRHIHHVETRPVYVSSNRATYFPRQWTTWEPSKPTIIEFRGSEFVEHNLYAPEHFRHNRAFY